ncbi:hypothetical protein GGX14DRAFT_394862 [Mycena pura]|uniref:Uncharacterized protein n=1 Tax=Mycena pura TaxID=153505 RepID=A0AAD6YBK0_9AGAR|nr:hypothetical protein GGX14DRAFT_394862 [Mycena pura]
MANVGHTSVKRRECTATALARSVPDSLGPHLDLLQLVGPSKDFPAVSRKRLETVSRVQTIELSSRHKACDDVERTTPGLLRPLERDTGLHLYFLLVAEALTGRPPCGVSYFSLAASFLWMYFVDALRGRGNPAGTSQPTSDPGTLKPKHFRVHVPTATTRSTAAATHVPVPTYATYPRIRPLAPCRLRHGPPRKTLRVIALYYRLLTNGVNVYHRRRTRHGRVRAISWRLFSNAGAHTGGITDRIGTLVTGKRLPRFSQALLEDGQLYYVPDHDGGAVLRRCLGHVRERRDVPRLPPHEAYGVSRVPRPFDAAVVRCLAAL